MIFGHFQLNRMNGHGFQEIIHVMSKEIMEQKEYHQQIIIQEDVLMENLGLILQANHFGYMEDMKIPVSWFYIFHIIQYLLNLI